MHLLLLPNNYVNPYYLNRQKNKKQKQQNYNVLLLSIFCLLITFQNEK
ncbi:Hypothetical protein Ccan_05470 [Capnocytophaga canimorsus Cc5]|uniref:Transmembrane protein n=1 Tax=Capnocytophaga canimorsus (strain 5) TaxID=860228 RepID=F9YSJ4_CAPCC|nr:Hypothetical protein Ccan_05470 [Capnocytophaga canimorsus Cc5]